MQDECSKCKKAGLHWKFNEMTQKNTLFENSDIPHICPEDVYAVNKTIIDLSTKYHDKLKFKIPIWCNDCNCYYKPYAVCGHILKTGFKEGVDGIDYFSDREDMKLLRSIRKAEIKKIEDAKRITQLGKFKPVDLRDYD